MRSTTKLLGASLAALSLAGCATIIRGTNEDFEIISDPAGATANLSNGESCVTPCELHLKRRDAFSVEFVLEGYQTLVAEVTSEFNGGAAVAGNAIFGGIIGAGVDASNGSLNNLVPNPLTVTLVPLSAASASTAVDEAMEPAAVGETETLESEATVSDMMEAEEASIETPAETTPEAAEESAAETADKAAEESAPE